MPPQTVERYILEKTGSPHAAWRFNQKCRSTPHGKILRIEVLAPAVIHWSLDGWATVHDAPTRPTGLGMHLVDLPTQELSAGAAVNFTFYWPEGGRWEGEAFVVTME